MIIAVICIIVVLLIIILWAVFTNNSLIAKKNRVKQCRSGICVVLKQRNDLIPNLVASVKAYMGHENEILTRIADLRSRASNATESEQIKGDGFFCGCRLIFFCFMMLRLNGLLYGFTDGNVPALRNPPAAFNIAVYIEFMFHDYTK